MNINVAHYRSIYTVVSRQPLKTVAQNRLIYTGPKSAHEYCSSLPLDLYSGLKSAHERCSSSFPLKIYTVVSRQPLKTVTHYHLIYTRFKSAHEHCCLVAQYRLIYTGLKSAHERCSSLPLDLYSGLKTALVHCHSIPLDLYSGLKTALEQ